MRFSRDSKFHKKKHLIIFVTFYSLISSVLLRESPLLFLFFQGEEKEKFPSLLCLSSAVHGVSITSNSWFVAVLFATQEVLVEKNWLGFSAIMLSNRSRAVASKKSFMADQSNSLLSPTKTPTSPVSSFLGSPRFFNGFLTKNLSDAEANVMSPTSILDPKVSSSFVNPFGYDTNLSHAPSKQEQEATGLALIDSINEKNDENGSFCKPLNRMFLFGSKLKVQIPSINPPSSNSPTESPKSPADFGIKTRNSQCFSPLSGTPEKNFSRQLSLKEMELSEDYTCVITYGPNQKTTHIFDDRIVENCCINDDEITSDHPREMESGFEINVSTSPSPNFLSFCHTCREILEQGQDIYIYRGEKAFCSHECRCQEMIIDGTKNPKLDDNF